MPLIMWGVKKTQESGRGMGHPCIGHCSRFWCDGDDKDEDDNIINEGGGSDGEASGGSF